MSPFFKLWQYHLTTHLRVCVHCTVHPSSTYMYSFTSSSPTSVVVWYDLWPTRWSTLRSSPDDWCIRYKRQTNWTTGRSIQLVGVGRQYRNYQLVYYGKQPNPWHFSIFLFTHTHGHTHTDPESESGLEVVEDEVGEGLWHGPHLGEIVSHDGVGQREGGCGPVREVAHHQAICGVTAEQTECDTCIHRRVCLFWTFSILGNHKKFAEWTTRQNIHLVQMHARTKGRHVIPEIEIEQLWCWIFEVLFFSCGQKVEERLYSKVKD